MAVGVSMSISCHILGYAHHCRGPAALDVLDDSEVDGDATAEREQQHPQQRSHGLDAPCSSPRRRSGLGPDLFAGPALPVAERYRNISRRQVRLRGAVSPGFDCDDGEARQQQHDGDGVQRLVKGERVVDGRRGAQVTRG
jgi:hypothetical protein